MGGATGTRHQRGTTVLSALRDYYCLYLRMGARSLPRTDAEILIWSCRQLGSLWNTRSSTGETLGAFLSGSEESRHGVVGLLSRWSFTARLVAGSWPLVAIPLSRIAGFRAWIENWKTALRRPDLFLVLGRGPYDDHAIRHVFTSLSLIGAGQFQYVHAPSESFLIDRKTHFARVAAAAGLPVAPVVAFGDVDPAETYIAKPDCLTQGKGIFLVKGSQVPARVDRSTHFLQRVLRNHRSIAQLVGERSPLSTLRVGTLRTAAGSIQVLVSILRLGVAGKVVDNYHAGGLTSGVDLHTGVLLPATSLALVRRGWPNAFCVTAHPETGRRFAGVFTVPDFQRAKALCIEAHEKMGPDLVRIGWDLALTDDGPIFIEAAAASCGCEVFTDEATRETYLEALRDSIARSCAARDRATGPERLRRGPRPGGCGGV